VCKMDSGKLMENEWSLEMFKWEDLVMVASGMTLKRRMTSEKNMTTTWNVFVMNLDNINVNNWLSSVAIYHFVCYL